MKRQYKKVVLLLSLSLCVCALAMAQRSITGKVTTAEDNSPLPSVSVLVDGTNVAVLTDAEGAYKIDAPSNAASLTFSFIGYEKQTVSIGSNNTIDVALKQDAAQLQEVVISGAFGIKRKEKALGYNVEEVKSDKIREANQPNLLAALQGQISGAIINQTSGGTGAGVNIVLRGINSLNPNGNNQPLIVLDGIIISNATQAGGVLPSAGSNAAGASEQFSNTNRLGDINPDDIESMSVLKGPAATALYGSRASNGAIILTTKKGQAGKSTISFSTSYSMDEINKSPALQSTYGDGRFGRLRFNGDGSPLRFQQFGPPAVNRPFFDNSRNFFVTGARLDNNLNVSGGNEKFTYFTSVGYFKQTGIVPTTTYDRANLRFNSSYKANNWLRLSGSAAYSNSGGRKPNGGDKSVMSALSYQSPSFDVNDYLLPNGGQNDYSAGTIDNARWIAEFNTYNDRVNRFISQVAIDADLTDWLSLRYQVGLDRYNDDRRRVVPPTTDVGAQVRGFVIEEKLTGQELNSNFLATIKPYSDKTWNTRLILGNAVTASRGDGLSVRGEGLNSPNFYALSNTTNFFYGQSYDKERLVGVFADASVDYKDILFLNVTGRNDWTSTLPSGNNSFFYGSTSLSFVFSDIEAFKNAVSPKIFSFGKLRLSYAETGKGTGAFLTDTYYNVPGTFPFGAVSGLRRSSIIASPDLRPERTGGLEFGADLRFFDNRFNIDFTYFDQSSKDQLLFVPVTNVTGYSRLLTNAGEVRNKGIELSVKTTPIKTRDFKWELNANYTKFGGDVVSVAPGISEVVVYDGLYIVNKSVPGGRVGDLYGFPYKRAADGKMLIGTDGFPTAAIGTYQKVGNALPDFVMNFNSAFTYKGFRLSGLLEWKSGGDVFDLSLRNSIRNGTLAVTERRHELVVFQGTKADGTPNTTPVEIEGEGWHRSEARYNGVSENLLQDASWVRLRNMNLSYTLPSGLLSKLPFQDVRLTLTGNNLWLNTPYRGYDPEALQFGAGSNAFGFSGLAIPSVRTFTMGLNVRFK